MPSVQVRSQRPPSSGQKKYKGGVTRERDRRHFIDGLGIHQQGVSEVRVSLLSVKSWGGKLISRGAMPLRPPSATGLLLCLRETISVFIFVLGRTESPGSAISLHNIYANAIPQNIVHFIADIPQFKIAANKPRKTSFNTRDIQTHTPH